MSRRRRIGEERHPALREHAKERRERFENRVADVITEFAGSMNFVYLHIVWFGSWIAFGVEEYPFGLLTMIVSLEAIFLSTFILISQNRADEKRRVLADYQWEVVNTRLISNSDEILRMTNAIHEVAVPHSGDTQPG
jgi:uncharacterized membrane protein